MVTELDRPSLLVKTEEIFPWLKHLDREDREAFYLELFATIGQALQTGDWQPVQELIEDWQATATILADTELTAILSEPLEQGEWEPFRQF